MTTHERQTVARLVARCRELGTEDGHLALKAIAERLGHCNARYHPTGGTRVPSGTGYRIEGRTLVGSCGPACTAWQVDLAAGEALLAAPPVVRSTQVDMFVEVAG